MKRLLTLTLIILFAMLAAGCVAEVVTSGDYTLRSGEILRGDLVVTSGDITLEEGSRVTGRVVMTSGVLDANGEVDGDVILTSGDVNLGPQAVVRGDVRGTSGHISRSEGAHVEGRVSTDGSGFSVGIGIFARIIGLYCVLPLVVIGALIYLFAGSRRRPAAAQE